MRDQSDGSSVIPDLNLLHVEWRIMLDRQTWIGRAAIEEFGGDSDVPPGGGRGQRVDLPASAVSQLPRHAPTVVVSISTPRLSLRPS